MRLGIVDKPALIDGTPGATYTRDGQLFSVLAFTVTAGIITAIDILPIRIGSNGSMWAASTTSSNDRTLFGLVSREVSVSQQNASEMQATGRALRPPRDAKVGTVLELGIEGLQGGDEGWGAGRS